MNFSANRALRAIGVLLAVACSSSSQGSSQRSCGQVCDHIAALCPGELTQPSDMDSCLAKCGKSSDSTVSCMLASQSCAAVEDCKDSGGSGGGSGSGGGGATGGSGGSSGDCSQGTCVSLTDGAKACLVGGDLPAGAEYCSYSNKCPAGKFCIFNSSESGCVEPCGGYVPPGECPAKCKPYGSSVCCGGAFCAGDCIGNPCC